jgi:hypothetical protein
MSDTYIGSDWESDTSLNVISRQEYQHSKGINENRSVLLSISQEKRENMLRKISGSYDQEYLKKLFEAKHSQIRQCSHGSAEESTKLMPVPLGINRGSSAHASHHQTMQNDPCLMVERKAKLKENSFLVWKRIYSLNKVLSDVLEDIIYNSLVSVKWMRMNSCDPAENHLSDWVRDLDCKD